MQGSELKYKPHIYGKRRLTICVKQLQLMQYHVYTIPMEAWSYNKYISISRGRGLDHLIICSGGRVVEQFLVKGTVCRRTGKDSVVGEQIWEEFI